MATRFGIFAETKIFKKSFCQEDMGPLGRWKKAWLDVRISGEVSEKTGLVCFQFLMLLTLGFLQD